MNSVVNRVAIATVAMFAGAQAVLLDGVVGTFVGVALGGYHDVEYGREYSALRFYRVRQGTSDSDVVKLLGFPLYEVLWYGDRGSVVLRDDLVHRVSLLDEELAVSVGMTRKEVVQVAGPPEKVTWHYSMSRTGFFETGPIRLITLRGGRVDDVMFEFHFD